MAWHKVAVKADVGEGEVIEVKVGEESIALYLIDGHYYATSNICTHAYALMHEGYVEGMTIECPLHQAIFDIQTGEALEGPVEDPLQTFPVKVDGDDVFLEI